MIPIVDVDDSDAATDVAEESRRILRVDAFHAYIKDAPWRPASRAGLSRVPKGLVIGTQFGDNGSTAKVEQLLVLTRRIRRFGPYVANARAFEVCAQDSLPCRKRYSEIAGSSDFSGG